MEPIIRLEADGTYSVIIDPNTAYDPTGIPCFVLKQLTYAQAQIMQTGWNKKEPTMTNEEVVVRDEPPNLPHRWTLAGKVARFNEVLNRSYITVNAGNSPFRFDNWIIYEGPLTEGQELEVTIQG